MAVILKIFCIICVVLKIESARILAVYPIPSISHQVVFRPLMHELAKRGHEVVVITPDPAFPKGQSPRNLTEIDVHDISYKIWNDFLMTAEVQFRFNYVKTKAYVELTNKIFEAQVRSDQVQKLIKDKSKKFDLLFVEPCVRIVISFQHLYNVPVIEFSSLGGVFGTFKGIGVPTNPLVYPLPMHIKTNNLTLWEKISLLYTEYSVHKALSESEDSENMIARGLFGPMMPDLNELKKNVHMLFLNVHPIWDFNRPVAQNVIYLGGIHQKVPKELLKELRNYLDASKNGVIYVSFGNNARPSLLPPEKLQIFTKVFFQLPYDILWKWDNDEIPGRPSNVRLSKWFPQSDLLKHPKIKLFITQGGLQSTDEALTAGVPLVVIPFLGDQWFNAEQYVRLNIGVKLDLDTINEQEFKKAIETVIKDKRNTANKFQITVVTGTGPVSGDHFSSVDSLPSIASTITKKKQTDFEITCYRENMVRLRNIMRDQPQSPLERAVWWTEYVLRHGSATHLRSAAAHMHWTEYYALDVVLAAIAIFIIILCGTIFAIRYVLLKMFHVKVKLN